MKRDEIGGEEEGWGGVADQVGGVGMMGMEVVGTLIRVVAVGVEGGMDREL